MEEHNMHDTSSHPFFARGGFPFVFLPSSLANGFNLSNHHAHVSTVDDQSPSESREKAENDENSEEAEEETTETIDDDEGGRKDENDESADEKSNLRISQPKYSQLLKELDFSQARMVDVTDLLPNELDQQDTQSVNDDNENENQRRTTDDEKYQSLSSARSSISEEEPSNAPTVDNNSNDNGLDDNKTKEDDELFEAANEIQNDLTNLETIIRDASTDKHSGEEEVGEEEQEEEEEKDSSQKRPVFDEEDDTSKQATQDYDLHENDQENAALSPKSGTVHHIVHQQTYDLPNDSRSFVSQLVTNVDSDAEPQATRTNHEEKQEAQSQQQQQQPFVNWENLVFGRQSPAQLSSERITSELVIESHSTPKKPSQSQQQQQQQQQQQPVDSSDEKSKPRTSSFTKQKLVPRPRQVVSSSTSSSDTDSIVEHALHRSREKPPSAFHAKQPRPPLVAPQPLRQDSQATLGDDNLDELTSQVRHVLDQERYLTNTNNRGERTTDGISSTTFPFVTTAALSTGLIDDDIPTRRNDDLLRHISNQRTSSHQQRHRHSSYAPDRSTSHRKKSHHQKYSASRHLDHAEDNNTRNADDDWLTMLERLEQEHQTRIEQQKKQYEEYMHTLEDKMARRFDDHRTLVNGSQESRSDDYDNAAHAPRAQTSLPMDSNTRKYNSHSFNHTFRPLMTDLVSHYYPADSTLNILSAEKKRSTVADHIPSSQIREDVLTSHTEGSTRHAKQLDDMKLRYEQEISDLRKQLSRSKLGGYSSSSVRQSMGTIERINSENIRLRDEMSGLRHSLKVSDDDNVVLKRQLDELREQINHKDLELKNYHRTVSNFERQLNEAENTKERHNEKLRHAERQASLYRDENEKLKIDLNRTRERLLRLEERSREQENENETLRRQLFLLESDSSRIKNRMTDDHKISAGMPLNTSSPREYQHFAFTSATKRSSSTISTPREGITDSGRYQSNDNGISYQSTRSPRSLTRSTDYFQEKPFSSLLHVSPSSEPPPGRIIAKSAFTLFLGHVYSPKKPSPNRRRTESIPRKDSFDRLPRQTEQLEQKFDQLLKKKRDLETRLHRIPARGLTNTDHQLYDVLEREIDRVDQQIMGVKLDLRKSNTIRTY